MNEEQASRDAKLLYEIGSLRHVTRTWRQFGGVPYANVAEHTLRVCWIAMLMSETEGANSARAVKLAMIHDVPEIRTGDVNYLTRMYVDRREGDALSDIFAGSSVQDEAASLWQEYEDRQSIEAKVVKDADTIDCDLELMESSALGFSLKTPLMGTRDRAYQRLYTKTGRRLFEAIYSNDPHAWHVEGKNRMTQGDWRNDLKGPLGDPD